MKNWWIAGALIVAAIPAPVQAQAPTMTDQLAQAMQQRQTTISLTYRGKYADVRPVLAQAIEAALRKDEYVTYDYRGYSAEWRGIDGSVQIIVKLRYSQTAAQAAYVDQEVKKRLPHIIAPSMDNHQKVKAIHDYIVKTLTYDTSMNQAINSPYYALTTGKTLCNGYAMLTYKMLKEAGIPVRLVSGVAGDVGHVWNLVQLDGKWYHLDTTWDDPLPDKGEISYDYYLLSDAMISADHKFKNGGLNQHDVPYPTAQTSYAEVLRATGRTALAQSLLIATEQAATPEALTSALRAQLMRYEPMITVTYTGQRADILPSIERALTTKAQYSITEQPRTLGKQTVTVVPRYEAVLRDVLVTPTLTVGDSPKLQATALMSNGDTFDVSNEALITTSPQLAIDNGHILAKTAGDAFIEATFRGVTTRNPVRVAPLKKRLYYPLANVASQGTQFNVAPDASFDFTFDEAVASANVFALTAYGEAVSVASTIEGNVIRITPTTLYPQGTTYLVAKDVTSRTGSKLRAQSYRITTN